MLHCPLPQILTYCKPVLPPSPPPKPKAGWPTFQSTASLQQSPWASYYKEVYGGLPTSFPVSTLDLWMLYDIELVHAKVTDAPASVGTCPTASPPLGQRYNVNNMYTPPDISWIWHPYPFQAIPTNDWAEILHEADPFGDEHYGAWLMYAPGSGIYFSIGQTISFAEHRDAFVHFGVTGNEELSRVAAGKGYTSIQFLSHIDHVNYQCDTHNTGHAGLNYMGLEILATRLVGTYACAAASGAPDTIKAGWQATRACYCDSQKQFLNCQGVPAEVGNGAGDHRFMVL